MQKTKGREREIIHAFTNLQSTDNKEAEKSAKTIVEIVNLIANPKYFLFNSTPNDLLDDIKQIAVFNLFRRKLPESFQSNNEPFYLYLTYILNTLKNARTDFFRWMNKYRKQLVDMDELPDYYEEFTSVDELLENLRFVMFNYELRNLYSDKKSFKQYKDMENLYRILSGESAGEVMGEVNKKERDVFYQRQKRIKDGLYEEALYLNSVGNIDRQETEEILAILAKYSSNYNSKV